MAYSSSPPVAQAERLLILARSFKRGGWCVAGKIARGTQRGQWVRPVGTNAVAGLNGSSVALDGDRRFAAPLDLADVPLGDRVPIFHQSENFRLSDGRWHLAGAGEISLALALVDSPPDLWGSARFGQNDRLALDQAMKQPGSLLLVRVNGFRLERVESPWGRKLRGRFAYHGIRYDLAVTDPAAARLLPFGAGGADVGDVLLTLSLALPHEGNCYKLVAAVLPIE